MFSPENTFTSKVFSAKNTFYTKVFSRENTFRAQRYAKVLELPNYLPYILQFTDHILPALSKRLQSHQQGCSLSIAYREAIQPGLIADYSSSSKSPQRFGVVGATSSSSTTPCSFESTS